MLRLTEREEARLDRPSMTGGKRLSRPVGTPQFSAKIGSPHVRFAALRFAPLRGHDSHSAARPRNAVLDGENTSVGGHHGHGSEHRNGVGSHSGNPGRWAGTGVRTRCRGSIGHRFLEAEEADFRWDARVDERWIGAYESIDDAEFEVDRIAICGQLDGQWFCATMLVDGDGQARGMMGCRQFRSLVRAREAMLHAH